MDLSEKTLKIMEREWRYYSPDNGKEICVLIAEIRKLRMIIQHGKLIRTNVSGRNNECD